jgi:hypothetical protein
MVFARVADPHHFNADPDPGFHFNTNPDPAFHSNADPRVRNQIPKIMRIRIQNSGFRNATSLLAQNTIEHFGNVPYSELYIRRSTH